MINDQVERFAIEAIIGSTNFLNASTPFQLFRMYMASRVYSPAVELNHQLGLSDASKLFNCSRDISLVELQNRCSHSTWALTGSKVICELNDLLAEIESGHTVEEHVCKLDVF